MFIVDNDSERFEMDKCTVNRIKLKKENAKNENIKLALR